MESTLRELSTNIEVITYLAQKTLDELTEMQAVIEEAMEQVRSTLDEMFAGGELE